MGEERVRELAGRFPRGCLLEVVVGGRLVVHQEGDVFVVGQQPFLVLCHYCSFTLQLLHCSQKLLIGLPALGHPHTPHRLVGDSPTTFELL